MKKLIWGLVAVILVAGLVIGTSVGITGASPAGQSNPAPTVTVATPVLALDKKAQVVIMGSGFEPGQEVHLLFTDVDGILADIGDPLTEECSPEPVANEQGAWATAWTGCGTYCSKELIKEGVYTITATDAEYNMLATAAIAFYDAKKPVEEQPGWAKLFVK